MSEATQEQARWRFAAYRETEQHYVERMGDVEGGTPPSDHTAVARQQLAMAARADGFTIDFASVEVVSEEAIVVDDGGSYRPAVPGEVPTGHIVTYVCSGHPTVPHDAAEPMLSAVLREGDPTTAVAEVAEPHASRGGGCRIVHPFKGEVTVTAERADGTGIGYLLATTLDDDTVHVEFFGGTAAFLVEAD